MMTEAQAREVLFLAELDPLAREDLAELRAAHPDASTHALAATLAWWAHDFPLTFSVATVERIRRIANSQKEANNGS